MTVSGLRLLHVWNHASLTEAVWMLYVCNPSMNLDTNLKPWFYRLQTNPNSTGVGATFWYPLTNWMLDVNQPQIGYGFNGFQPENICQASDVFPPKRKEIVTCWAKLLGATNGFFHVFMINMWILIILLYLNDVYISLTMIATLRVGEASWWI